MKKVAAFISTLGFLSAASSVFAQLTTNTNVSIAPPSQGVTAPPNVVLTSAINIVFILAGLAVLFMLIFGAFQWITSGGEKEGVEKARKRIMAALVGLAVLALSFLIVRVIGGILNVSVFGGVLPTLNGNAPAQ